MLTDKGLTLKYKTYSNATKIIFLTTRWEKKTNEVCLSQIQIKGEKEQEDSQEKIFPSFLKNNIINWWQKKEMKKRAKRWIFITGLVTLEIIDGIF